MRYDFSWCVGCRSKSARGLAQSKTLTRLSRVLAHPSGLGVRWPSTALAALTVITLGLTSARAESLLLSVDGSHGLRRDNHQRSGVLVRDGKIAAVGKSVSGNGAKEISLTGQHLYPGMTALNTDLGLAEIEAVRSTLDKREVGEYTPDVYSWLAVNPDSELLPVARANGVAHFEPTPAGAVVAGQSGLMALDGWTTEQMVVRKAMALHVYWPSASLDTRWGAAPAIRRNRNHLKTKTRSVKRKLRRLDDFFAEARAYAKPGRTPRILPNRAGVGSAARGAL
ncbi:MAG: hypothetical protein U1F83_05240 [Verrucomicrobiota bacterium]